MKYDSMTPFVPSRMKTILRFFILWALLPISPLYGQPFELPFADQLLATVEDTTFGYEAAVGWSHGERLPDGTFVSVVSENVMTVGGPGTAKFPSYDLFENVHRKGVITVLVSGGHLGVKAGDKFAFDLAKRFPGEAPRYSDPLNTRSKMMFTDDPLTPNRLFMSVLDTDNQLPLEQRMKRVRTLPSSWSPGVQEALQAVRLAPRAYSTSTLLPMDAKAVLLEHAKSKNLPLGCFAMLRLFETGSVSKEWLIEWIGMEQFSSQSAFFVYSLLSSSQPVAKDVLNELAVRSNGFVVATDFACGALAYLRKIEPRYYHTVLHVRVEKRQLDDGSFSPQATEPCKFLLKLKHNTVIEGNKTDAVEAWNMIYSGCLLLR